jgi:nucleoside-diphosphate-sugar epimerase
VSLLSNFLTALEISTIIPKRFILQTGAKHYGLHLGPPLSPEDESDPRFLKEKNFYFPQEDILWEWTKNHGSSWNVTRPGFIIGAVPDAAMNITYGLALYAAVQAELGLKLEFPGDNDAWYIENHMSYAPLIAYHAEWAALNADAADQVLNHSDGSMFSFGKFWPQLAAAYGLQYSAPEQDENKFQTVTMPTTPPPRGFGPPGKFRLSWSFEAWANKKEVLDAWATLKKKHGLTFLKDPFGESVKDVFGLLDAAILGPWGRSMRLVICCNFF